MRLALSPTSIPFAVLALGALLLPLTVPACGGDNASGGGDSTGAGGSGSGGSGSGGSAAATCNTTGLMGDAGPCGCLVAENHEICPAKGPSPDCSKGSGRSVENCGVLIDAAKGTDGKPAELVRTTTTKEYAGTGAPDVACFAKSNWKQPGASKVVTLTGYARNFANGCDSAGGEIEVHKVVRTGGADDGSVGDLVGTKVTVVGGACAEPACKKVLVDNKCEEGNERKWWRFEYPNVPTETELVIVTKGKGFATIHEYNLYISEGDPDLMGDKYEHDVRVALDSDYTLIPTTATGSPIDPDKGAIAGEVHDCGNIRLTHATVDISSPRSYRGYFTDNEDSPLPDPNRKIEGTSTLSLYSALNVPPGPVRISATGILNGKPVTLGYFDARVEAGVVTSVTLRGLRANQAASAAGKLADPVRRSVSGLALALLAGCAGGSKPSPRAPDAPVAGRLSRSVVPERYALDLTVDPDAERFRGTSRIAVRIDGERTQVMLHGRGLTVSSAKAKGAFGDVTAKVESRLSPGARGEHDELHLTFEKPVSGPTELTLEYDAKFDKGLAGLYRVEDGGKRYAFTQFEPMDARRAFPCFDEPGWKTPFEITVHTPKANVVVGNAPKASDDVAGEMRTVKLSPTPPLPTYLVALAVGPLDRIEKGRVGLVATNGRAKEGAFAAETADKLLGALEGYFGVPYAYGKLDLAAVPEFAAGAMENPGLVTFREELLLFDPKKATTSDKRRMTMVVAHELAHQWFGNYVTAAWWDDLWLNEGFATWMEAKAADRAVPGYSAVQETIRDKTDVMDLDTLPSARAVRQPVSSPGEALEAFDGLTYEKGAAILAMLESTVGESSFQKAIRAHLAAHPHGNATTDAFFRTIDEATGAPLSKVAATFVEKPGVPLVDVDVVCGGAVPKLVVKQSPLPGIAGKPARPGTWHVPVTLSLEGTKRVVLLDGPSTEVPLATCPAWVIPNVEDVGYYRYRLSEKLEAALAKAKPTTRELAGFTGNQISLVRVGALPPSRIPFALFAGAVADERIAYDVVVDAFEALHEALPPARHADLSAFARTLLDPTMKEVGWASEGKPVKKGRDAEDVSLIRRRVGVFLGTIGESMELRVAAKEKTKQLLDGAKDLHPEDIELAVLIEAFHGHAELHAALVDRLAKTREPTMRVLLVRALALFQDPVLLRKTLDLALTDAVKMQDLRYVLGNAFTVHNRPVTSVWMRERWDDIKKKVPPFALDRVMASAGKSCSAADIAKDRAFFVEKAKEVEGGDREIAIALERSERCAAFAPLVADVKLRP